MLIRRIPKSGNPNYAYNVENRPCHRFHSFDDRLCLPQRTVRSEQNLIQHDSTDAYAPAEIAQRVENAGVAKAGLAAIPTLVLAVLAGAFIAFGAMLYVVVVTNSGLGFGPERLLGGLAFSLGLILVLVGGAELFTGNSLIVFAWADRKITGTRLLRNWGSVYLGNFIGATATAVMVHWSGIHNLADAAVGAGAWWWSQTAVWASAPSGCSAAWPSPSV